MLERIELRIHHLESRVDGLGERVEPRLERREVSLDPGEPLVDHGETGYLVPDRDPAMFAHYVREIIDHPLHAAALGRRGAERAKRYTWGFAAARLRRVYADVAVRELVACA